ncbi:MAG: YidC/Oxa1 family membrane protein insertase [Clostridia bacterium]|nr:YidC/Oxa1 family membrane protein insertase [Clostridia bacterium]
MKKIRINKKTVALIALLFVAMLVLSSCMTQTAVDEFKATKGFWNFLAVPLGYIMKFFASFKFPYVITLFFFAVIMKLILFPFGIKQQKNSLKQAALRPKEMAIRKKYAGRNDKATQQKVQQEIMELYEKEGYNPMGGCMPLLLQFPILFALFEVVYCPLRYVTGLSIDTINKIAAKVTELGGSIRAGRYDLYLLKELNSLSDEKYAQVVEAVKELPERSKLPDLTLFGLDLAGEPSKLNGWYLLIPALTFVIVYLTALLTRKLTYQPQQTGDAKTSSVVMDIAMPAMSAFFAYTFPAILGVYWMFQNLLGVLQQLILKKMYPIPVFTDEDYKKAEHELRDSTKEKKKKPNQPQKRHPNSLHHIDDDDDDVPVVRKAESEPKTKKDSKNSMIDPAPLKEEETDNGKED